MALAGLNHVNILARNLEVSAKFYESLGLKTGPRPTGFPEHGIWLYHGDSPVLHLNPAPKERPLNDGAVDHFGFSVQGSIQDCTRRLTQLGIEYDLWEAIPGTCRALYFKGPSGEKIEFVFVDQFVNEA